MKKSSQIVRWESPYLSKGKPLVKMNYVSMQIHRFSRSLAMVVLGDFSTLCSHFCARRARDALHSTLTVDVQKKALEPKFSFGRLSFPFFNLGTARIETIELGFRGNENQSGRKFCVNSIPFFALLFFRYEPSFFGSVGGELRRLNNPQSARGR